MKTRIHSEPLPRSGDALLALFKRSMQLPSVTEVVVTPTEFRVSRALEDDDEVVFPKETAGPDADLEHLLAKITSMDGLEEAVVDPRCNPYIILRNVTKTVTDRLLRVVALVVPRGPLFADYFGLEEGAMPDSFMGIRVTYHDFADRYPDKLVVLGGPTIYFNDATLAVIVDTGV